jgi:hypothetical protein
MPRRLRPPLATPGPSGVDGIGGVARIDAPPDDRRQAAPARHQQARQSLSSKQSHSWRAWRARRAGLLARAHKNVVVVALANKLARIAWVVLARGGVYDAGYEAAAA